MICHHHLLFASPTFRTPVPAPVGQVTFTETQKLVQLLVICIFNCIPIYIMNFFMSAIHFFMWSSPLFLQTWKMVQTIIPRRLATASASHTRLGRALPKLGPTSRLGTCLIMNYIILISFNAEDK